MVTKVFQLLLLLSPICIGTKVNMDMFDIIFFRTGVMALFMASLWDRPKREAPREVNLCVLSLLGLVLFNMFIHTFNPGVMSNSMNLFIWVVGFYIVYRYIDLSVNLKKAILWAAGINLAFFIIQRIGYDPIWDAKIWQEDGALIGNKQRMMTYFALVTPFLSRWFLIIPAILGLYTGQYVIFIPIGIMALFYFKDRERWGVGIILALLCVLLRKHIFNSLSYRFVTAWRPILETFFDRPLLGLGIGNSNGMEFIGSSWLQFISGLGVMSVAWVCYFFKKFVRQFGIPLITLLAVMSIEYPVEMPRLWFLVMAIALTINIKEEAQCL